MAVRHTGAELFAAAASAMATRHVGRCPRLVDEYQPLRIEIELALELGPAPLYDVRTVLLARTGRLFCA